MFVNVSKLLRRLARPPFSTREDGNNNNEGDHASHDNDTIGRSDLRLVFRLGRGRGLEEERCASLCLCERCPACQRLCEGSESQR